MENRMQIGFELLNNKIVLVVDDSSDNRLQVLLTLSEFVSESKVLSAQHGKQALEILEKRPVDLILLDWDMPVMDGMETLLALKANPQTTDIPVVMFTGIMTESINLQKALTCGAIDFIRRPVESLELVARLRSVLTQQDLTRQKQELYQQQIAQLREELSQQVLVQANKNSQLIGLFKFLDDNEKTETEKINQTKRRIRQIVKAEDYWTRFLEKFQQADPGFLKALLARNLDLTESETRLCTLVRLGFDNKTAAQLLHVSTDAVKKSRQRIRKKVELNEGQSLTHFLMEI